MYKIYSKTEKVMQQNSLSHLFLRKEEMILTVCKQFQIEKIIALSDDIICILKQ